MEQQRAFGAAPNGASREVGLETSGLRVDGAGPAPHEPHRGPVPATRLAVVAHAPRFRAPLRGEDQAGLDELDTAQEPGELGGGAGAQLALPVGAAQGAQRVEVDTRVVAGEVRDRQRAARDDLREVAGHDARGIVRVRDVL
jgi:hypothetical protein